MRLLIACPCYNEAATIASVLAGIPKTFTGVDSVRLLVIDDGSSDDTAALALKAGAMVIRHKRNMGLGSAFRSAVDYAVEHGFDLMVNMDGDGQFNPADIQKLIDPILRQEADFVYGSRFTNGDKIKHMSHVKRWGNRRMNRLVSRLCDQKFSDVSCGFRAYSRETLLKINFYGRFTYTQESFLCFSFYHLAITEAPVEVRYFPDRKSHVSGNIWKFFKRTSGILFGLMRDYYPMRFFSAIAIGFLVPTAVFGLMFLINYLLVGYFSGYLFAGLIAAFCSLIAVLMFSFGLAMESIVRVNRNENRILYQQRKLTPVQPEGETRIIIQ